jgi:hypothetical protein
MIEEQATKDLRGWVVRWTVHMDANVLKNGNKNSSRKKGSDPDNKSSRSRGK